MLVPKASDDIVGREAPFMSLDAYVRLMLNIIVNTIKVATKIIMAIIICFFKLLLSLGNRDLERMLSPYCFTRSLAHYSFATQKALDVEHIAAGKMLHLLYTTNP